VSRGRSNSCNPLAPRIDKNLGNTVVKKVWGNIVEGYVFYHQPALVSGAVAGEQASLHRLVCT
jgi:hypothetical protein